MKVNILSIIILSFCCLLECNEKKNNSILPYYDSEDPRNIIMPFHLKSQANFILNLRYMSDYGKEMKMIVIEYDSKKSFMFCFSWKGTK